MVKNLKLLLLSIAIGSFVYVNGQDSTKAVPAAAAPAPKVDSVPPSPATTNSESVRGVTVNFGAGACAQALPTSGRRVNVRKSSRRFISSS